ncbi:hypothetical protein DL93DRAFT_2170586 [Clavulina sp. PMI_390]|nr:hypothetical protein DL93DRAFT_2170586 [Clavulina sp. PMI_390]
MQANVTNLAYAAAGVSSAAMGSLNAFSMLAAAALSGVGATLAAGKLRVWLGNSSTDPLFGVPLTKAQVFEHFPEGTWQREAYDAYSKVLLDEERIFPCIYATRGHKSNDQLYIFIDSDDLSNPKHIAHLAKAFLAYLPQARSLGPNTSLVMFSKHNPNPKTVEEYNLEFWKMLDGLARLDKVPWPSNTPRDIDTDNWCLCFNGEQLFCLIQTPAHQQRLTRYAPGVIVGFQPKWVLDELLSTDAKRAGAMAKVRGLLKLYDPMPISPELKNYGEPGSRDSRQYFLMDSNEEITPCPYTQLGSDDEQS